jgi:hypothetical protein
VEDAHLHFAIELAAGRIAATGSTAATAGGKGEGGGQGRGSTDQTKRGLPIRGGVHENLLLEKGAASRSDRCAEKVSTGTPPLGSP